MRSCDPNDILGPEGYGDERFVSVNDELGYTIRFENDPELAEGPAQVVLITQDLSEHLNPLSFRLGNFGFADFVFEVPANMASYNTRLDLRDSLNIYLDVVAGVNVNNNEIFWLFTSVDPATGATPNDPFTGFLAVNDSTGVGEGFVTYSIYPDRNANTGDIIFAEAAIIFDVNEPIITPEIFNTIDALPPSSEMDELDEFQFTNQISLSWTAQDDDGGSGVRDFFLYVSEDGSPLTRTAGPIVGNSFTFAGEPGIEYGFAIRARDNVFNIEPYKDAPETTTMIDPDLELFIAVNAPVLDDVFCVGSELPIEWVSFGVENVRIELTSDGEQYQELIADTLASAGLFNWFIPMDYEPGNTYLVRIVSLESDTILAHSAQFTISALPMADAEFEEVSYLCADGTLVLAVEEIADYTYQWYLDEELLEGEEQASVEVSEPGIYYVYIANESGCILILNRLVEQVEAPEVAVTEGFEICLDAEAVTLEFGLPAGGEYSGEGVENGQFDPSVAGEGSFYLVYTLENEWGCIARDSVLVTVNVFDIEVSLDLPTQICVGSSPFTLEGGLPEGGVYSGPGITDNVFDPAEAGVGEHVITYAFSDDCGEAEATASIEVLEGTPEATFETIADVCMDDASFELTGGLPLGGEYSGTGVSDGLFDPSVAGVGAHEITYTYTDECGATSATIILTVLESDFEVTLVSFEPVCEDQEPFLLTGGYPAGGTYSGPGISENIFDPAEAGVGIHEITYVFEASCGEGEATASIEVFEGAPEAIFEPIADVCVDDAAFELTTGTPDGGVYTGPGVVDGILDPQLAGAGTHELIYTLSNECGTSEATIQITVLEADFEVFLAAFDPVCEDVEPFTLTGGYPAGGIYSGPGVTGNVFDPVAAGVGIHEITYVFEASCGDGEATATIEVLEGAPEAFFEPIADVCLEDVAFELTTGMPAGGVYAGPGVTEGVFDPQLAGAGTHELSYTLTNECGTSVATIIVTVLEADFIVSLPDLGVVCEDGGTVVLTGGYPSGGIYMGAGVSDGVFDPSAAGAGIHEITYTFTASCGEGEATATIEVLEPTPQATLEAFADVCAGSSPFELTGGLPIGGTFSGPGVSNGMFDPVTAGPGTHEITYTFTDVCGSTEAVATITVFESVPELVLTDAILYLDENGTATLTIGMVDAGSFDVCTDFVLSLDSEQFTCDDLGENLVEVTAVNEFGQSTTETVVVTVVDEMAPVVITRDIVVQLDENGTATIAAADIDDGSYDNCEIAEMTLDQYTFDQTHVGLNIVTLTVTDSSGNSNSETAEVMVEPSTSLTIIPEEIGFQAYPNPFGQHVTFEFRPTESAEAKLALYDATGALITVLYSGDVNAGQYYRIQYNAGANLSGVVIYKLELDNRLIIGRLIHTR